jgi:YegS/Rv2252/BmrU family lipid kinase
MYVFIVNPTAGSGRAMRIFSKIQKSKLYKDIKSRYFLTKYNGHAEKIVSHLVNKQSDKISVIIVIGGDGTLHEVVNGIGNYRIPIAIIPSGSGNDFSRATSRTKNPLDIFQSIVKHKSSIKYWLGNYQISNRDSRYFVNSIGFGFDAEIAQTVNESYYKKILNKLKLGKISYVIALIQVLRRFKPLEVEVEVDGQNRQIHDCWMVTVTNHPYYGGGMKIVPDATIKPSVFPVLIIHSISKWKVLGLFMTVFTGKHIYFKEIEIFETTKLKISSTDKMYHQVDGETFVSGPCVITKQSDAISVMGAKARKIKKSA